MDYKTEAMQAWTECGRCGDAYYRAMTDWLTLRSANESAECVYNSAMIYENALRKYLDCLKTVPASIEVEHEVARAFTYRSFLTRDIEFLLPILAETRSAVFRQSPDRMLVT